MAAVTKVQVLPVEVVRAKIGKAAAALVVGDPVVIDEAAAADFRYTCKYKKAVAEQYIDGVVLKVAVAGGPVEVMIEGEFEGYSGMTPGAKLTVAAGSVDSVAPGAGVYPQLRAVNATRLDVRI